VLRMCKGIVVLGIVQNELNVCLEGLNLFSIVEINVAALECSHFYILWHNDGIDRLRLVAYRKSQPRSTESGPMT